MSLEIAVSTTFFGMANWTQLLDIVQNVIEMIAVDVINLGSNHTRFHACPIYETQPAQMAVMVAAHTGHKWYHPWGITGGTITGFLASTTHRSVSLAPLFGGVGVGYWTRATVIDAGRN